MSELLDGAMSSSRSTFPPGSASSSPSVDDVLGAAWAVVSAIQAREEAEKFLREAGPRVTAMLAQKRAVEAAALAKLRAFQGAARGTVSVHA